MFIAYRWGKQEKPRRQAWSGEYLQGEKKARPAFLKMIPIVRVMVVHQWSFIYETLFCKQMVFYR
jgi:hypothetical protein